MAQFTIIKLNKYRCGSSVEVDLGSEFLTPNLDPGFLGINWWLVRVCIVNYCVILAGDEPTKIDLFHTKNSQDAKAHVKLVV